MASFASSSAEAQHPILWAVEVVVVCTVGDLNAVLYNFSAKLISFPEKKL
jgi:hypothetical protein